MKINNTLKYITIILSIVIILVGTNLIGAYTARQWKQKELDYRVSAIEKILDNYNIKLSAQEIVNSANSVSIAVIQTKLDDIKTSQDDIKILLKERINK